MRLAHYASVAEGSAPNLLALQDEALPAWPTVLVCPLKAGMELTGLRAAQIVFCKSSGGQAEGEMDGSMLR